MAPSNERLININTHSIALYTHGPDPESGSDPAVLFINGISSSHLVWTSVIRNLPPTIRSYTYDRSGFGNSEISPNEPTAETIAAELELLINGAEIRNPLILVGHSWAGVLIMEFLVRTGGKQLAGLVLVDANHESALSVLNPNDPALTKLWEGVDFFKATGIEAENKLTRNEYEAFVAAHTGPKYVDSASREEAQYEASFVTLRAKKLVERQPIVSNKPVFVIGGSRKRDWSRLFEDGVLRGNGTEAERNHVRHVIGGADGKSAGLMREWSKVSNRSEVVFAQRSGHFVQLTEPELVIKGILWALENLD